MGEGLFGKIFGKGKNKESGSVGAEVVEAVAARAVGDLGKAMTLKFKNGGSLSEVENDNKICIDDNLIYNLINQCTDGELDKKIKGTKKTVGEISTLTIPKDTLLKFREVLKNEDLAKALQMTGSVSQVASLGVLVVAAGMLKKANVELDEINQSVSEISNFQNSQYKGKVAGLMDDIQGVTEFQMETMRNKDERNRELMNLRNQENNCAELLNQADSAIQEIISSEHKSFKNYVDNTANIEKWYNYQNILILLLKQISELKLTFSLGVISQEKSFGKYEKNLPRIIEVRKELRDWHLKNMGYYSVDLKEKKYQRVGSVFDAAKRIPIGALANKISENTISDDMIKNIEKQTNDNYDNLVAASGNQFEEDVKMVVEDGKLYYVS